MKNKHFLLALHTIEGLGSVRLKNLLDCFDNDPQLIWQAKESELINAGVSTKIISLIFEKKSTLDPEIYAQTLASNGIKTVTVFDEQYPSRLKEIFDPPLMLYYFGDIKDIDRVMAIVGTRKITGYGKVVTEKFAKELSGAGFVIVSGLARGIDSVAHQSTLDVGGITWAVLGGGLGKIFPPENTRLSQKIAENGGAVISELPPDYPSLPGNFPARNRIISGLSQGVLVVEAAAGSGSLITARSALEQGREVFAVPGPINSELSQGPLELIRQGAKITVSVADILEEFGVIGGQISKKTVSDYKISNMEKIILEELSGGGKHIDEICRQLQLSASDVSSALIKMEISGLVQNMGGGIYSKIC